MIVSNGSQRNDGIFSEMCTAIAGKETLQLARLTPCLDEEQRDLTYQ